MGAAIKEDHQRLLFFFRLSKIIKEKIKLGQERSWSTKHSANVYEGISIFRIDRKKSLNRKSRYISKYLQK